MKKIILIIFALFSIIVMCATNQVHIKGNSTEYAGSKLIFYKYADRITYMKEKLFEININQDGLFEAKFNLDETTYVFGEFGIYHAYFFAEPGKEYELILPPFDEKKEQDIFNPFFTSVKVHIGIKDLKPEDLNYLILDFDYYYLRYLDLNFLDVYSQGLQTDVDTFINSINLRYKGFDNEFFNNYRKFRIAALKSIATQKKYEKALIFAYYTKSEVLYENPAYMDLFNNIFEDYFDKYLISEKGAFLYTIINYGHSISRLKKLLHQNPELRAPQFRELVILKGLNDAFSNNNLSWLPLLLTLDSVHLSTPFPQHKIIAQNIADNSLSMAKGTVAPPFELLDTVSNVKSLSSYRGKYVYLHFANTSTISSQMEFALMQKLYERYKGVCIFVSVLTDKDKPKALSFIRTNKFEWEFLFTEINSKVISSYNVVTYPTYYLIDPHGTLLMSPAPSPSENFEKYFFNITQEAGAKN